MNKIESRFLGVFIIFLYLFSSGYVVGMEQDPDEQKENEERLKLIEKRKERFFQLKHSVSSPSFNGDPFKYVAKNNYAKVKGLAVLDPSLRKIGKNEEESLLLAAIKNLYVREKKGDKDEIKRAKAIIGLMLDPKNSSNLTDETIEIAKTFAKTNKMFAVIFALDSVVSVAQMKKTADRNFKELQGNPESYNEYKKIIFSSDENRNEVRQRASSSAQATQHTKEEEGGMTMSEILRMGPEVTEERKKDEPGFFEKLRKKPKKEKKEKIMVNQEEHKKKIFEKLKLPWEKSDEKKLALIAQQVKKNTNMHIVKQENPPPPANSVKSSSSFSNSNPNLTIGLSRSADESPKSSSFEKYYGKPGLKKFDPNNNNNNQ